MTWLKAMGGAAAGIALWLTANLGEAWWILLGLLALDAVLNYDDEAAWLRRLVAYMATTAITAYMRHGLGIAGLHAVVFGMVAYEAVRVGDRLLVVARPMLALLRTPAAAAAEASLPAMIQALQARVDALAAQQGVASGGAAGEPVRAAGGGDRGLGVGIHPAPDGGPGRGGGAGGVPGGAPEPAGAGEGAEGAASGSGGGGGAR